MSNDDNKMKSEKKELEHLEQEKAMLERQKRKNDIFNFIIVFISTVAVLYGLSWVPALADFLREEGVALWLIIIAALWGMAGGLVIGICLFTETSQAKIKELLDANTIALSNLKD